MNSSTRFSHPAYFFLPIIFVLCLHSRLMGQEKKIENLYLKGNSALLKGSSSVDNTISGDYSRNQKQVFLEKSVEIWKEILKSFPEDPDANFKLGLTYLRIYDKKFLALPYLQKASKHLVKNYSFNNSKGGGVPFYALYYLAEAYRVNNLPDSALAYYSLYRNHYKVPPIPIEDAIFMALNSKQSLINSRNVKLSPLTELNSDLAEYAPVLSIDGNKVFYCARRSSVGQNGETRKQSSEDIYFSERDSNGKFSVPVPYPFNTEFDEVPLYLTSDGKTLFIRSTKNKNADIYYSDFLENQWTKPVPLAFLNSGYNENSITLSVDGKTIYFSSDRPGGTGGFDIYETKKLENGSWSEPFNLAYPINTSKNEICPSLAPDGATLYYSSNGIINLGVGGYDIYYSEKKAANSWSMPQNMGNPINKSGDDFGLYAAGNGVRVFAQVNKDRSFDLFEVKAGNSTDEELPSNVEVVTVVNEMAVAQIVETEKEVEKEVTVVEAVETQVEVEKEVQVTTEIEVEKIVEVEKEVIISEESSNKTLETETGKDSLPSVELTSKEIVASKDSLLSDVPMSKEIEETGPESELNSSKIAEGTEKEIKSTLPIEMKGKLPETNPKKIVPPPIFENGLTVFYGLNHIYPETRELRAINEYVKQIKASPDSTVFEIIGHADRQGTWEINLKVSTQRAKKVFDQLIKQGVPKSRLIYYGMGFAMPQAGKLDADETDRRVEIKIYQLNK